MYYLGVTERLNALIEEGLKNDLPLPSPKTFSFTEKENVGFFRKEEIRVVVGTSKPPEKWEVAEISYERSTRKLIVQVTANLRLALQRKEGGEVGWGCETLSGRLESCEVVVLSPPQAALVSPILMRVGELPERSFSHGLEFPNFYWGTLEDLEEVKQLAPHLCGSQ